MFIQWVIFYFLQPMPLRLFNGPGFHYILSWRRSDSDEEWSTKRIDNSAADSALITTNGEYEPYEIRVRAANDVGMAPTPWSIKNVFPMSERNYTTDVQGDSDIWLHVSGSM